MEKENFIEIYSEYTDLQKYKRGYIGLCPFHEERTPSFAVDMKGSFMCFGCGRNGNPKSFLEQIRKTNGTKERSYPNA